MFAGPAAGGIIIAALLWVAPSAVAQPAQPGEAPPTVTKRPQNSAFVIARLKYAGGGDWYNDQSSEVNMLEYLRKATGMNVRPTFESVDIASDNIFNYPLLFLTGHGNVNFSETDVRRLRAYLLAGGFLYIDDDYGLDTAIRREMHKVFPGQEFQELPFSHPIYHAFYQFPNGLPKIHEHDNKPPRGFGLFAEHRRLCVFYTYETNPSDGWADPDVHNDPPEKREEAFKIGTNIIVYALTN
ncbi:MAG: DUF4159 domain-containing protein [Bacteroidetes bacterium]|nr:DUF4159 domain-containing protein [Bacteroidota bacterium]